MATISVNSNALSMGELFAQSNDPIIKDTAWSFIEAGSVFTDIPLEDRMALSRRATKFNNNLATPDYVPLNTGPTIVKSKATPYEEQAFIVRNGIDVDEFIAKDENALPDFLRTQTQAYLKGTAFDLNDKVVNNNHVTGDVDCFVGLRARLDNPTLYNTLAECKVDAGGVDLSDSGQTAATTNNLLVYIQKALDSLDARNGNGVIGYGNDDLLRKIEKGIRQLGAGGGWSMDTDAYGNTFAKYRGCRIKPIGRRAPGSDNSQAQVITSTETSAGVDGSSTMTSMYFMKTGEDHLTGWQSGPFKPRPQYTLDEGVISRILFSWMCGLWIPNNRSIARVYDIKMS